MKFSPVKKLVFSALCSALCVILPMLFHFIPNAGTIFLPMHIPVLLCGMLCGWPYGLGCGLLGPMLSSLLTKMPPMAVLPAMMVECAVYGAVSGFLMQLLRDQKLGFRLYGSLIPAMLCGRIVSGIAKALIFSPGLSFSAWLTASFVTALPGIITQLILLPLLLSALMRAHLIPQISLRKSNGRGG